MWDKIRKAALLIELALLVAIAIGVWRYPEHAPKCHCLACNEMWATMQTALGEAVIPPAPPETLH